MQNTSVSIDHDYHSAIEAVIKNIKRVQESEITYFGKVQKCHALPDLTKRKHGEIILVYLNDSYKNVTSPPIVLPAEEYDHAVEAHRTGKLVKVVGTLSDHSGRKKIEASYLEVLS